MKRTIPIVLAIAALTGLAVAAVHEHRMGMAPPMMHGLMPQIMQALHTMDLSSDQKEAIHKIVDSRHSAMEAQRDQAMSAHGALRSAILSDTYDEGAIRNAAAAIASLITDGAVADGALLRDVRAELSAEQRDQLTEILSRPPDPDGPETMRPRHHGPAQSN